MFLKTIKSIINNIKNKINKSSLTSKKRKTLLRYRLLYIGDLSDNKKIRGRRIATPRTSKNH